jgi:hypothetical protein
MAITEGVPGVTVSIESQGRGLPEYADDDEWNYGESTTYQRTDELRSTWNAFPMPNSKSSVRFKPLFKLNCQHTLWVCIDGQAIGGLPPIYAVGDHWSGELTMSIERISGNEVLRERLKFASIQEGCSLAPLVDAYPPDILQLMMRIQRELRAMPNCAWNW